MLKLKLELLNARHVQGRKDPSRYYTIVEGIVTLPSGMRSYAEAFLQDRKAFSPGPHVLEVDINVDQNKRITARCVTCYPEAAKAAA